MGGYAIVVANAQEECKGLLEAEILKEDHCAISKIEGLEVKEVERFQKSPEVFYFYDGDY